MYLQAQNMKSCTFVLYCIVTVTIHPYSFLKHLVKTLRKEKVLTVNLFNILVLVLKPSDLVYWGERHTR